MTTTLLLTIGLATAVPAVAQTTQVAPADTVDVTRADAPVLSSEDYADALGIKDWDKVDDNALLPITSKQAEELITKMIVASRADSQRKLTEAEVLNDFKVETLKNKLLQNQFSLYLLFFLLLYRLIPPSGRLLFLCLQTLQP